MTVQSTQKVQAFVDRVGEQEAGRLLETLRKNPKDVNALAQMSEYDVDAADARALADQYGPWKTQHAKTVQGQGKTVSTAVALAEPGAMRKASEPDLGALGRQLNLFDRQIAGKEQEIVAARAEAEKARLKVISQEPGAFNKLFHKDVKQAYKALQADAAQKAATVSRLESEKAALQQSRTAALDNALSGVPEFKEIQSSLRQTSEVKTPVDRAASMLSQASVAVDRARQGVASDIGWEALFGGQMFPFVGISGNNSGDAVSACNGAIAQVNEAIKHYNRNAAEQDQLTVLEPLPKVETGENLRSIVDVGTYLFTNGSDDPRVRAGGQMARVGVAGWVTQKLGEITEPMADRLAQMQSIGQTLASRQAALNAQADGMRSEKIEQAREAVK